MTFSSRNLRLIAQSFAEDHRLVLSEHLNQYGFLFGCYLLMWIDEIALMAASLNFRECPFVTVDMKEVASHRSVREGAVLSFETRQIHREKTSVRYSANVLREDEEIFSTEVTQVGVDELGQKQSLPNGGFFVSLPLPNL